MDKVVFIIITIISESSSGVLITDIKVPNIAPNGADIALHCNYCLHGDSLYSLKWHFNNNEFYRYTPRDFPSKQMFPLTVLNVDIDSSTNNTAMIRRVSKSATGRYKCEISIEHTFETVFKEKLMIVVDNASVFYSLSAIALALNIFAMFIYSH